MSYVCYTCEYIVKSPLVKGVALHCCGAVGDASSLLQLLEMSRVVQLAACRPASGFCSDPSGPPGSSLEEMGNSCFELRLRPPAAKLVLQQSQNAAAVDRRCVCFGGRWGISCYWGANVQGFLPSIVGSIRSQSMEVPCWRCVDGLKAALGSHCCGRRGRGLATAGEGEAGCKPWWGRQEGEL